MQRIAVVRREDKSIVGFKQIIKNCGFKFDQKNPDFVLSIGGDGTFLIAERLYPGIPKVLIKESKTCIKCEDFPVDYVLNRIKDKKYKIEEFTKLEASFGGKVLKAANDIVVRNKFPTTAIRFVLSGGKELIGDGIVVATAFGSLGYFYSITKRAFKSEFGLAYNNLTVDIKPKFISKVDMTLKINRGDAVVVADNNEKMFELKDGDKVHIYSNSEKARIVRLL